ncbi:MAG: M48 family metalloprotease, partial [Planctomycetota bacterium]
MQLYPILLIGVLLAWDGGMGLRLDLEGWAVAAVAGVPVLAVLAAAQIGVLDCRRRLAAGKPRAVVVADRLVQGARWALLVNHAVAVLIFGWLGTVRSAVGDLVLVDEIIAVVPTVAGLLGLWWIYHPIELRVREAILIRRLDEGQTIFQPPRRGAYVLAQARLHLLFLLVPILLIVACAELIDLVAGRYDGVAGASVAAETGTLVAALAVVTIAPLLSRVVLDVEPLPLGPVRDDLLDLCRQHRVRVRRLLLWNTHGVMINAAVMGLVGGLRYVLLTDALLETMTRRQLHAVMAHEIGHIRRRHMPWLIATLLAMILVPAVAVEAPLRLSGANLSAGAFASPWFGLPAATLLFMFVLSLFG